MVEPDGGWDHSIGCSENPRAERVLLEVEREDLTVDGVQGLWRGEVHCKNREMSLWRQRTILCLCKTTNQQLPRQQKPQWDVASEFRLNGSTRCAPEKQNSHVSFWPQLFFKNDSYSTRLLTETNTCHSCHFMIWQQWHDNINKTIPSGFMMCSTRLCQVT